jgi:acylphosphatase
MIISKRVLYSGRVQGVGFRYTAQRLAEQFPVAGYVRNLSNGSVEMAAEGEAAQVDAFLQTVAQRMGDYIRTANVQDQTPANYQGFEIRY